MFGASEAMSALSKAGEWESDEVHQALHTMRGQVVRFHRRGLAQLLSRRLNVQHEPDLPCSCQLIDKCVLKKSVYAKGPPPGPDPTTTYSYSPGFSTGLVLARVARRKLAAKACFMIAVGSLFCLKE